MLRDYSGPAPHTSDLPIAGSAVAGAALSHWECRCSADVEHGRPLLVASHSANPIWMGCCWWTCAILVAILWLATLLVDIDFTWCRGMSRQITRLGEMSALLPIYAHDWGNALECICVPQCAHHLYHLMQNHSGGLNRWHGVVNVSFIYAIHNIIFCWSIYPLPYERINFMRDQFIYLNHHYSTDDEHWLIIACETALTDYKLLWFNNNQLPETAIYCLK